VTEDNNNPLMDIRAIMDYLPHRYPFLLIDRVVSCEPYHSLVALKNVTYNEPCFQGHFPQRPIFPGVLIIEALAQATGILAFRSGEREADREMLFYLVGIDKARFKHPVEPGDQLRLEVHMQRFRSGIGRFIGEARVGDKVIATAELMCAKRGADI